MASSATVTSKGAPKMVAVLNNDNSVGSVTTQRHDDGVGVVLGYSVLTSPPGYALNSWWSRQS